jgi:hypothetical protein
MMSPMSKLDPQTAAGLPEQRPGNAVASRCRFFQKGVAALCGLGLLVVSLTLWLAPDSDLLTAARRGVPVGGWVLQVLITGNLAIGLLWIWLDWLAWRRRIQPPETRGNLLLVALVVAAGITFFCLILAGTQRNDEVLAMAMFLAFPTLAVMLPLLWVAVRRIESVRLGTLILAGFVAASGFAQGRIEDSLAASGESLFVVNSYLVGLAVAVWLLSWAAFPEPSLRSAGWQPAVSPTGSRLGAGFSRPLRIANPRYGRLPVCATAHGPEARPILELESTPQPPRTA